MMRMLGEKIQPLFAKNWRQIVILPGNTSQCSALTQMWIQIWMYVVVVVVVINVVVVYVVVMVEVLVVVVAAREFPIVVFISSFTPPTLPLPHHHQLHR